jgi:hypothetical protein
MHVDATLPGSWWVWPQPHLAELNPPAVAISSLAMQCWGAVRACAEAATEEAASHLENMLRAAEASTINYTHFLKTLLDAMQSSLDIIVQLHPL